MFLPTAANLSGSLQRMMVAVQSLITMLKCCAPRPKRGKRFVAFYIRVTSSNIMLSFVSFHSYANVFFFRLERLLEMHCIQASRSLI
jgi:hypothetical protein